MLRPMSPEEIAEYIHEEHTPYAELSYEDGKKHLAELIQKWADYFKYSVNDTVNVIEVTGIDFNAEEQFIPE